MRSYTSKLYRHRPRRALSVAAVVAACSLAVAGCGDDGEAEGGVASGGWDAIEEAAGEEGEVVFYSSDSDAVNGAVVAAFNEEYPDIEVEVTRAGVDIPARVASEEDSGIHSADVLASGFQTLHENADYFLDLDESVLPTLGEQTWPAEMTSDTWVANKEQFIVTVWNSKLYDGDQLETWSDLLDPALDGKILVSDPRGSTTWFGWLDAVVTSLGEDYPRQVAEMQPGIGTSGVPAAQDVAAGSYAVGFPQSSMLVADLQAQGATVDFKVLTDPIVLSIGFLSVFENAPHPNAARVFANFRASPAGMAAMCSVIGPPGETGFSAPFTEEVPECDATPTTGEVLQGDKTLEPTDQKWIDLVELLGLDPQSD